MLTLYEHCYILPFWNTNSNHVFTPVVNGEGRNVGAETLAAI